MPVPYTSLSPRSFSNLPVELICHILTLLDIYDLIQCSRLSKQIRKVVLDSSQLQYAIELGKHRMTSLATSPSRAPSYISRLKLLRDREAAWRSLTWSGQYHLQLPSTGSVYEFVGGFYAIGNEDDRRITSSISILELPSASSGCLDNDLSDLNIWTHSMPDVSIIDFTMDPSQDLLVLVALSSRPGYVYELHLRSMSTNEPHADASVAILPCLSMLPHSHQSTEHVTAVRVQVCDNLVALLIKDVHGSIGAHLEIWDWQNNPHISCKMARISGIDDFTFLTSDAFLLVLPTGNFEVYKFQNPLVSGTSPIRQAIYDFPPLSKGYMYWYITMSSNPTPGFVPHPKSRGVGNAMRNKQVYYPNPEERIHACCMYIINSTSEDHDHRVDCFVFFVSIKTLLRPPEEWLQQKYPRRRVVNTSTRLASSPSSSSSANTKSEETRDRSHSISVSPPSPSASPHPSQVVLEHEYLYVPSNGTTNHLSFPTMLPPLPLHASFPIHNFFLPSYETTTSPHSLMSIPWSLWGPQNTRWFRECLSTDWQHSSYGLKTIEYIQVGNVKNGSLSLAAQTDGLNSNGQDSESTFLVEKAVSIPDKLIPDDASSTLVGEDSDPSNASTSNGATSKRNQASSAPRHHLRLRDFNPYAVSSCQSEQKAINGKGKGKMNWLAPHVITEPSITNVRGVFKDDIKSCLPYVEVISKDAFEVTDVMMDDSRLLLLKRGNNGKLRRVDVLTL